MFKRAKIRDAERVVEKFFKFGKLSDVFEGA